VDPREAAVRAFDVVELGLLAHPENAERNEAHQVNEQLRKQMHEGAAQIGFTVNELFCRHMKFEEKQSHGHAEDAIAQRSEALDTLAGDLVVRDAHRCVRIATAAELRKPRAGIISLRGLVVIRVASESRGITIVNQQIRA
jgi:hypothetical protein